MADNNQNNTPLNLDDIIGNKTATTKELRAEVRAKLPNIYLSKDSLAKLESLGFGRAEILMSHTPKEFVSVATEEVLHDFGFLPEFDADKALQLMTKDYIVKNYAELTDHLGAKIDFNFIFSKDLPREIREFYAEQLVGCGVDHTRLLSHLHHRAIFFLAKMLMLYGAKPNNVMKKLDAEEIKIYAATFKRYGIATSDIRDRIVKCSKTPDEGVARYVGKYGPVFRNLPVYNITCLNCGSNHVYFGYYRKHFCCERCAMVFRYKLEARREIMEEMKAGQNGKNMALDNNKNVTKEDIVTFESDTKDAIRSEIKKWFYKDRSAAGEEEKITKHANRIYDNFYGSGESPAKISPDKVIIMYRDQVRRKSQAAANKKSSGQSTNHAES